MRQIRLIRHINLGVKSLLVHKLRSLLTMLGVMFGVGSVVAMLAVGEGAKQNAMAQIVKLGARNIIINSEKPQQQNASRGRSFIIDYGLKYEDFQRIETSYPTIEKAVAAKLIPKQTVRVGDRSMQTRLVGTTPGWFDLVDRPVLAGRVLEPADQTEHASICVITEKVARDLLGGENPLDATVRIAEDAYQVVGVVQSNPTESGGMQTPDRAADVYVPLATAREYIGDRVILRSSGSRSSEDVELHQIIVQVDERRNVRPTADAIHRMLDNTHDKQDYAMDVPLALLERARETQRTFTILLGATGGISLLVGGIGIMNIMLASVTERTREIGVRRAIGARQRQIIGQFLIETMVLSVVGGLIGVALGAGLPEMLEPYLGLPIAVTPESILLALGISATVGVIFGLYPAYRAAALDPIVALRHE